MSNLSNIHTNYEAICKCFNFKREITSDSNKQILLDMAKRDEPRPPQKTRLGQRLCAYTNSKSPCYDEKFTIKIKKIRPEWFVSVKERMTKNKELFLEMAKRGDPRPNKKKHPLGAVFSSYINPSQKSTYDEAFTKKIKNVAPHWFVKKYEQTKAEILRLAADKKQKKPTGELGKLLRELIRTDRGDVEFSKLIKDKRPDWFVDKDTLKSEVLRLVALGLDRKQILSRVGRKFLDYVRNEEFRKKIKKIRSDFFVTRSDLANEKKKRVLFLARKNIKPNKHLLNCMYQWFGSDKEFTEKFNKINPKWYKSKKQRELGIKKNKEKIIQMAINGKKPSSKSSLGRLYNNATSRSSKSYDPEFRRRLKEIRKDWFKI